MDQVNTFDLLYNIRRVLCDLLTIHINIVFTNEKKNAAI